MLTTHRLPRLLLALICLYFLSTARSFIMSKDPTLPTSLESCRAALASVLPLLPPLADTCVLSCQVQLVDGINFRLQLEGDFLDENIVAAHNNDPLATSAKTKNHATFQEKSLKHTKNDLTTQEQNAKKAPHDFKCAKQRSPNAKSCWLTVHQPFDGKDPSIFPLNNGKVDCFRTLLTQHAASASSFN